MPKYLITGSSCAHCHRKKEKLKEQLASGEIIEKPIETDDGIDLAVKFNIDRLPTLLECDAEQKTCEIIEQGE